MCTRRVCRSKACSCKSHTVPAAFEEHRLYNLKATLAYKGTAYKGWQVQNGKSKVPTIQEKIEAAICAVKCEDRRVLRLQGAGRTDAGVHARGQARLGR